MVAIQIDSREPEWVQKLTFGGAPVFVTMLSAGDVWVATGDGALLVIERKTPDDFLNTLRAGRLFLQAAAMRDLSPWCYLVITGDLLRGADGKVWVGRGSTGWDHSAVQGAIASVQELGVSVLHCGGDADYEACVLRLAARDRAAMRIQAPRESVLLSSGEQLLASLPGVGLERIGALLTYCGTPAWALAYLTGGAGLPVDKVPGIGAGTKTAVRRALGLDDSLALHVLPTE